jgi:uncharacterized protein
MQALIFGSSRTPLFGVYHEAQGAKTRDTGVVMCPPLWHEYVRAHRAMRNVAALLSRSGHHVFRFDYYGTGDSGGNGEDGTVAQWLEDIDTAAGELKDTSGVSRVTLVGVRFGATLATVAAQANRTDLDRLVLWDPIASGADYLAGLRDVEDEWLESLPHSGDVRPGDAPEMFGFPLSHDVQREIEAVDLGRLDRLAVRRVHVLDSSEEDGGERVSRILTGRGIAHTYMRLADQAGWGQPEQVNSVLLPRAMVQTVAGLLGDPS